MSKVEMKKEVMFNSIELKGKSCSKFIDIHIHFEKHVGSQFVGGFRWQAAGNIHHNGKSVGIFRYWLNVKEGRIQPTVYAPLWMPDPKGNGIDGVWTKRRTLATQLTGKLDLLGQAIWFAVKHYSEKLNADKAAKTEPAEQPFFMKPVCDWTREEFISVGVTNRGYLEKTLKACEVEKPQKLKELTALKCGFGPQSYKKAVEILVGMGCSREVL